KQRPHHNAGPDDLLFREFIYSQEQASFDSRKRLVDALRDHARAHGREVAFCTNAADLGSVNPGGHWVRALMFADIFDLFIYEQNVEPIGMTSDEVMKYPRGKWIAYHKLAHAIHHRRAPAVIHAGAMGRLIQQGLLGGKSINTWLAVQSAEAYAANGAYVQYYIEPKPLKMFFDKFWMGSAKHAAFVQAHRDMYEGDLRSGSPLALVFLMNERGRTIPAVYPSYLGFAQGLAECHIPFDVVFAGDGHYVEDRLARDDLKHYQTLIVPSPLAPTRNQQRVIGDFVRDGGTIVCHEPGCFGFSRADDASQPGDLAGCEEIFRHGKGRVAVLRGDISETWTDDIGSNYFKTYEPELRAQVGTLAQSLGISPLISGEDKGLIGAFPVRQPALKRLVLHLVNYDVDYAKDAIREKRDVAINVLRPDFLPEHVIARLYSAEKDAQSLDIVASDDALQISVPHLGVWATIAVTGE
ncbi:MAG TPA: hypothetical protein VKU82_03540, partial [Planctomycetaceae bacterium]|nr:hypothetical protein [Planctomycetaceae bacterium]